MLSNLGLDLYRKLFICRRTEEHLVKLYPEDEMRTPMHMSIGQEVIPAGVCHALTDDDQVFSSYRSHAAFLAKTEDIERFLAEFYGKVTGTAQGKAGSLHLAAPERGHMCSSGIVAATIPPAVGAAFANKQRGDRRVSCVFFGDGATDEGHFWESLNVACLMTVPVLFICEDNGFAVHTPTEHRQGFKSLVDVVGNFDIEVFDLDTTDIEEIYQTTNDAVSTMRSTARPVFMRFKCFRYLEHVGVSEDFDLGYRTRDDLQSWQERDALQLQRKRLADRGYGSEVSAIEATIEERIEEAVRRAQIAAFPSPEDLYTGVFHAED